ncbi:C39 family peptidase [Candidatus Poribacteria bacterium]|nr:C39 family peptidase [Candidatus Poribacteria bacterium]
MIRVPHLRQKPGSKSCLVISVKMVLDGYGVYRTEEEIGTVIEYDPVLGASIMNIDLLPEAWGVMTESGEIELERVKQEIDCDTPVIVVVEAHYLPYREASIRANHTLVVVGYDDDNIYVNDALLPEAPTAIPVGDFLKAWDGLGKFGGIITKH